MKTALPAVRKGGAWLCFLTLGGVTTIFEGGDFCQPSLGSCQGLLSCGSYSHWPVTSGLEAAFPRKGAGGARAMGNTPARNFLGLGESSDLKRKESYSLSTGPLDTGFLVV